MKRWKRNQKLLSTSIIYVVYEKCKFEVEVENYKFNEAANFSTTGL